MSSTGQANCRRPDWEGDNKDVKKGATVPTFGFTWGRLDENDRYRSRKEHHTQKLSCLTPDVLRSIIKSSVIRAESEIRTNAENHYRWLIRRRDDYIEGREKRRLTALRRHETEVKALLQSRIDLLEDASLRIAKADRLRSVIAAFDEKAHDSRHPIATYEKWRRWAMQQISEIDPRCMSSEHIGQWIEKFHLH